MDTDRLGDENDEVYHPNEDVNRVLSVLRDFKKTNDDPARPLAIVTVEKFLLGAKEQSALNYGTIRNAFEETDGELCIRYEDEYGHGYFGLLRGELRRFMQMSSSEKYNGPYGTTVDLLDRMLDDGSIQLCLREQTPFGEISDPGTSPNQEGDPELRTDGGTGRSGNDEKHWKDQTECQSCDPDESGGTLRAIKMKSGGRDLLCFEHFCEALDNGDVDPTDPRFNDDGTIDIGIPNAPGQTPHRMGMD